MLTGETPLAGARILVVDDDPLFLKAALAVLERLGCQVTTATNGKTAAQVANLEDFDAVISDIRMPEMNGIELTHHLKKTRPVPVILITGFAEIRETQEAHSLGADAFLAKPFRREELLETLQKLIKRPEAAPGKTDLDLEFCRISIDDFISGKEIKYNIFIRITEDNYIKIAHEGQDLSLDRIRAYKEKGVHALYLRKEDFARYMGFTVMLLPLVRTSSQIPKAKKLAFVKHAQEVMLEQFFVSGVEQDSYKAASTVVENSLSLISDREDLFQLLDALSAKTDPVYAHSLGVSIYSTLIAKAVGWKSTTVLYKIAMGALLHDIGLRELDPAIATKTRIAMSAEDRRIFETHPSRGLEILAHLPNIPDDIIQIAYQHHEDCRGLGYPLALTRSKIHPMAKLVAVADEFCCLLALEGGVNGRNGAKIARRLAELNAGRYDPEFLAALLRIFGLTDPHLAERHRK